jgi:hypothetical protein
MFPIFMNKAQRVVPPYLDAFLCLTMLPFSFAMFYSTKYQEENLQQPSIYTNTWNISRLISFLLQVRTYFLLCGISGRFTSPLLFGSMPGFGYETDAIEGASQNPLRQAFIGAFAMPQPSVFMALLHKYIPPIRFIVSACGASISFTLIIFCKPDNSAGAVRARNGFSTLYRIGKELVDEKKEAVIKDSSGGGKPVVTLSQMEGRDILSALGACPFHWGVALRRIYGAITVRSNMAPDLKPLQIMSDDEVLARGCILLAYTWYPLSRFLAFSEIVTLFVASRGVTA